MGATEGFMRAEIEQLEKENKLYKDIISDLQYEVGKYKEENKNLKEENKKLKEKLSEITMVADDEKQSIEHILELEEENRKLKERIEELEKEIEELNKMMLFETKI